MRVSWIKSQDMKEDADVNRHLRSFYARSNVVISQIPSLLCVQLI